MRYKLTENIPFYCRVNIFENNVKITCAQLDLMKEVEAFDN